MGKGGTSPPTILSSIILPILFFLCIFTFSQGEEVPQNLRHLSSFSFREPFFPDAGSAAVPSWEVKGSALVTPEVIHLTPQEPNKAGYITNRRPFFLKTTNITIEFSIHSQKGMGIGGLALWLKDTPFLPGNALGAAEKFTGAAIAVQTNPRGVHGATTDQEVSLHYNDGKFTFGMETKKGGCSFNFFNQKVTTINVVYTGDSITVTYIDSYGAWKNCVYAEINLPDRFFYSISASTSSSDPANSHDVMSLQAYTFDPKKPVVEQVPQSVIPSGSQPKDENENKPDVKQNENEVKPLQPIVQLTPPDPEPIPPPPLLENNNIDNNNNNNNNNNVNNNNNNNNNVNNNNNDVNEEERKKEEKKRIEEEKKQMLIKSFPSEEFFESYAGDDDEDVMNFIEDMKEAYGHQLLELQFYFRDQISLLKSKFPSSITDDSPISKDLQIVEEEIKLSASEVQKIKVLLNTLGLNSLDPRASGAIKNFDARIQRIQTSIKTLNNLLESVQGDQRELRQLELADNSDSSNLPFILIILVLVAIVGIVFYFMCKPKSRRSFY